MERITNRAESNQPTSHVPHGLSRILCSIVGIVLAVAGTAVLLFGFFLEAFRRIEGFPKSDLAREITMFLGACLLCMGLVIGGKQIAVGLGSVMLLAGIAMYSLGFTSDHPLAVLFPFVGVFVGLFGCFSIAFGAGWLNG